MLKNLENNGTEEIGLVTPTPELMWLAYTLWFESIGWNPFKVEQKYCHYSIIHYGI